MKTVNIIIDDDNRYFAAGLRLSIAEYARANNKAICFLAPDSEECPDVLFASSIRCAQRGCTPWHAGAVAQNVAIEERRSAVSRDARRILRRTARQSELFLLLEKIFAHAQYARASTIRRLTQREQQVVSYLRRGFGQSQTARVLGVSVKTVHSHKRSVMQKMNISKKHDFIHWMINGQVAE
jgi:fimbrial protein FimW